MKKIFISLTVPALAIMAILMVPMSVPQAQAEVRMCPTGFVCTPIKIVCPSGYSCTPMTAACPIGFKCTPIQASQDDAKLTASIWDAIRNWYASH